MLKKILLSPWTAILTLVLVLGVRIADPSFVESVRLRYFDTLITSQPANPVNIVTANIDEAALDKYGQWPFRRDVYSEIILDLYKRGAGLVVFNVMMPEKDRLGGDAVLSQVMKSYPVIVPNRPDEASKNIPRTPGSVVLGPEHLNQLVQYPGIIANIPEIESAAVGSGTTHTKEEIDGVNRRMPLVIAVGDKLYPGLAIETLRVLAQDSTFQLKLNEFGVEKLRVPSFGPIATDSLGRVWIDWSQQSQSYSITQLPADLKGATIIVGVTAAGLGNPVPTAKGPVWPHEVQAATLATMITGTNIQRPDYADGAEVLTLLALGLIIIFLSRWTYVGIGATVVGIIAITPGTWWLFTDGKILFDTTAITAGIVLVALHCYGVKFVSEFLQKMQIKKQFGTYLSPAMVEKLQKNPELLQLGGEERELSIMFTDVRGFTSISEHYGKDVQGLTKIMNRYMTVMTGKIIDNNGTLDKYIGDAQMAFWNAPLDDPDHAKHAVQTALEMLGDLDEFNKEIAKENIPAFGMGLGINTGSVVVGNMGSRQRFDYTCLGDSVNLASRLEGQSKPYGVKIVIGSLTNDQVKDEYYTLELDCIAVKGKKEGVNIYTVLGKKQDVKAKSADRQLHDNMLKLYRQQEFNQAIAACKNLTGRFDGAMDHYYELWVERCEEMKNAKLPKDWDGVYRATSK